MVYTLSQVYNQSKMKIEEYLFGEEYNEYYDLLTYNRIPALTTCIRTQAMIEYIDDIEPQKKKKELAYGRLSYVAMDKLPL